MKLKKKKGGLSDMPSKKSVGMSEKKEMKGVKNPLAGFKEESATVGKKSKKSRKKKEPSVKDYIKGAF